MSDDWKDRDLIIFSDLSEPQQHAWEAELALHKDQNSLRSPDYLGVVSGWHSLTQLARRYEKKAWVFRGQSQRRNLLAPIGRPNARKDRKTGNPREYSLKGERRILEEFKLRCQPYLAREPASLLEWMAIARHHGLPTRLLDWTQSFLVAAMFACKNSGIDNTKAKHPEILALKGIGQIGARDPFEIDQVCLYRPPHITPRIPAQQGIFTVHNKPDVPLDGHEGLERWVILSRACFHIKKMLDIAGINESTIYPDMDGLGRYLQWCYKWDMP